MSNASNFDEVGQPRPVVTWRTAATCLIMGYFAASCGKQADQPSVPQKAKVDAIDRNSVIEASRTRSLAGQVFVTQQGGDTVKLALTEIRLAEIAQAGRFAEMIRSDQEGQVAGLNVQRKKLEEHLENVRKIHHKLLTGLAAIGDNMREADAERARLLEKQERAGTVSEKEIFGNQADAVHLKAMKAAYALDKLTPELSSLSSKTDELQRQLKSINKFLSESNNPAAFFDLSMLESVAKTTTDADGRFTIMLPTNMPLVLAAQAERPGPEKTEKYAWLTVLNGESTLMLNNRNMLSREGLETLCLLARGLTVPRVEHTNSSPATPQAVAYSQALLRENPSKSSLAEQLRSYQHASQEPATAHREELEKLKHAIASDAPELDVPEIRRDAEVSSARLLNDHSGMLYKFAGLILEISSHDVTIVMKNTEVVCSFADASWKNEGLKVDGYLYACGHFESYKDGGDFKQISMANCYTIENFYKLRTTPFTPEKKQQSLKDWEEDKLYKLRRDLGERKLLR